MNGTCRAAHNSSDTATYGTTCNRTHCGTDGGAQCNGDKGSDGRDSHCANHACMVVPFIVVVMMRVFVMRIIIMVAIIIVVAVVVSIITMVIIAMVIITVTFIACLFLLDGLHDAMGQFFHILPRLLLILPDCFVGSLPRSFTGLFGNWVSLRR